MGLAPDQQKQNTAPALLPKISLLEVADDSNIQQKLATTKGLSLVYLWGENCKPCGVYSPQVEEIAKEFSGRVKGFKFDAERNLNFPEEHNVRGLPTVIIFRDGQQKQLILGAEPDKLRKALTDEAGQK